MSKGLTINMMNLYPAIKAHLMSAILSQDETAKGILRVVLGELDNIAAKRDVTHDDCLKVIKKCVESNNEIIKLKPSDKLSEENVILTAYLPDELTVEEIFNHIKNIELGNNLGKAISVVVKYIREKGLYANGKDIRAAVEQKLEENTCS